MRNEPIWNLLPTPQWIFLPSCNFYPRLRNLRKEHLVGVRIFLSAVGNCFHNCQPKKNQKSPRISILKKAYWFTTFSASTKIIFKVIRIACYSDYLEDNACLSSFVSNKRIRGFVIHIVSDLFGDLFRSHTEGSLQSSESIEWLIECQAFSRSYDLAPRPPPPSLLPISSTATTQEDWETDTGCWWERGKEGGRGAESFDRKKAWSFINHSIFSVPFQFAIDILFCYFN